MASRKNRVSPAIPISIMVVMAGGVWFLSKWMNTPDNTPPPPPKPAAASAGAPAGPPSAPGSNTALAPEIVVNDPAKAMKHIMVGWQYDSEIEKNPGQLQTILEMLQGAARSSNGRVSLVVADLDLPPDQLSPASKAIPGVGIYVEQGSGKSMIISMPGNPGEGSIVPQTVGPQLMGVLMHP